jgi:peptide/nickel transport system substrate-binding protein
MTTFGSKLTLNSLRSVTNNLVFLGVNPSCAALSTAPLRRALSAVLSRSTLLDDNVASGGFVALSPINPRWFLFDSAAVSRGTDPSYAETALREEGYLLNEETGLLTSASGKTLSLRLLYNGANAGRAALALSIVNQLTDFGYAVTPVEASAAEYPRLVASGSFDLYLGEVRLTPDMNLSPLVETGGSLNTARFSSAALDEALRAMKSASAEQLEAAAFAMIEALDRETPVIPLYFSIEELVLGEPALETVLAPTPTNPLAGLEQLTLSGE